MAIMIYYDWLVIITVYEYVMVKFSFLGEGLDKRGGGRRVKHLY